VFVTSIENQAEWLSAYLFVPGQRAGLYGDAADSAILEVVAPFIAECRLKKIIDGHFFIRYRENGAHIRLRISAPSRVLFEQVQPALISFLEHHCPGIRFGSVDSDLEWPNNHATPVGLVKWVPYSPEFARYGGVDAMSTSELLFRESSDTAIELLRSIRGGATSRRLGLGLLSMLALVHPFIPNRQESQEFFANYSAGYLKTLSASAPNAKTVLAEQFLTSLNSQRTQLREYVNEAWRRLESNESVLTALDSLTEASRSAAIELAAKASMSKLSMEMRAGVSSSRDAIVAILASHVHMHNNRLGIRIDEEAYLAKICVEGLQYG
jgi:thiopeptide-type bacteriocin biosynthesis protein